MAATLVLAGCHSSSSSSPASSSTGSAVESSIPNNSTPASSARVPSGAPAAAFGHEPQLPGNSAWIFSEGSPRTSGTGRYAHGAFYWTDFLYDASGAKGVNVPIYRVGTPSGGSLHYPDENMAGNGADIFRVGIGLDNGSSYWRVDWLTLLDPSVPIAAFAVDYKDGGSDGWPGISGLRSPGIDAVIFLSSKGVLVDFKDGNGPQAVGEISHDLPSQSFVAKLPAALFGISEQSTWTVYLASGIHDGNGGFLDDNAGFRKLPTQPPVFNMAFRDYSDEPPLNNFWFDDSQSIALNSGDVSAFALALDWGRMGETEPEPLVSGYSNRWYVSSLIGAQLGDGSFPAGVNRGENPTNNPQYFDRIQPYGIYVPKNYKADAAQPTMFTWLLHSLTQNHNQYSATVPNFLDGACERLRQSICATTLGRGGAGSYRAGAEVDFWEVWRDVAQHFTIDGERTISAGYSMGAIGTINLMIKYPEVFAGGVILAGSNGTLPLIENLKWNGYYQAHGSFDELVPFPEARATVDAVRDNGYRYVFDHYFAEDHVVWTLKDEAYSAYEEAAQWMVTWLAETGARKQNPGNFVYRWNPEEVDSTLGIGPRGAWWLDAITAVEGVSDARIELDSGAIAEASYTVEPLSQAFVAPNQMTLSPAIREEQRWNFGEFKALTGLLSVKLLNVAALRLDLARAGIAARDDKRIEVSSGNPVSLTLTGLVNGTLVRAGSVSRTVEGAEVVIQLPAGDGQSVVFD
jgi:hypothetical protein